MNNVTLTGRLAADPEVRYTPNGKAVAQFRIAVQRDFANSEGQYEADFIPCVIWDKQAEFVGNNFYKGKSIEVEGRIQVRTYDKDGSKVYVTEVVCRRAGFCGDKDKSLGQAKKSQHEGNQPPKTSPLAAMGTPLDDEIPF